MMKLTKKIVISFEAPSIVRCIMNKTHVPERDPVVKLKCSDGKSLHLAKTCRSTGTAFASKLGAQGPLGLLVSYY